MTKVEYVHIFRRRRIGKTDYRKRRGLIVGKQPLLAVRVSNKYVYCQILRTTASGDVTLCSSSSRDLAKGFGWKGSTKNLPAAYLTGYLLGKRATAKQIANALVYTGIGRFVHGSRITSAIQGARDAGLNLAVSEEILPEDNRRNGEHVAQYAKSLETENRTEYGQRFSKSLASGFSPADYPKHLQEVKAIIGAKGSA